MFDYINQRQFAWAGIYGKALEPPILFDNLYTCVLNDNLAIPLSKKTEDEFNNGHGDELSKKMRALYSSSAFGVNTFEYWRQKYDNNLPNGVIHANNAIRPLIESLNLLINQNIQQINNISFEKQNVIFPQMNKPEKERKHPHLDINIECIGTLEDIAFECKYREPFYKINKCESSSDWTKFEIYLKEPLTHWKGLENLHRFAREKRVFRYLDVVQLMRHILGLNIKHGNIKDKYILVFLYCPSYFDDNVEYTNEIKQFINIANNDRIRLISLTYYDLFKSLYQNLLNTSEKNDINYLNYNVARYL
jgi:hypothetical protein